MVRLFQNGQGFRQRVVHGCWSPGSFHEAATYYDHRLHHGSNSHQWEDFKQCSRRDEALWRQAVCQSTLPDHGRCENGTATKHKTCAYSVPRVGGMPASHREAERYLPVVAIVPRQVGYSVFWINAFLHVTFYFLKKMRFAHVHTFSEKKYGKVLWHFFDNGAAKSKMIGFD